MIYEKNGVITEKVFIRDLVRIDSYNTVPSLSAGIASDSVEWHVKNAYNKSFFFCRSEIPEFFDICDLFVDAINDTGRKFFTSEIYGFPLDRRDLSVELVQDALIKMKMEFINIEGQSVGSCQNILFENWEDD